MLLSGYGLRRSNLSNSALETRVPIQHPHTYYVSSRGESAVTEEGKERCCYA